MKNKQMTAVEWFFSELERMQYFIGNDMLQALKQAKEMEKEQMIKFHKWMLENDTEQNADKYFHFTNSDMLNEYYKQD
jgi:hypothetical protein